MMFRPMFIMTAALAMCPVIANGSVVFSNDFEVDATGFTPGGVLPALTRTSLPIDGGGLASANQSTWLGRIGEGVTKSLNNTEIVNLTVTGLTSGVNYIVAFDLLIGRSWDGAASGYGTDAWYFSIDGSRFVDTMFSNGDAGIDYGAYSPQRYSDTNYANPNGPDVAAFTGAEFSRKEGAGYTGYYGIYYFSHGTGNPVLSFQATGTSAVLEWARFSGGTNFGDSGDEYWALDYVQVSTVPELNSSLMIGLGLLSTIVCRFSSLRRSCD